MSSPIILVLDYPDRASAIAMLNQVTPELCRVKIGKELFTRLGPEFVKEVQARGFDVFLDLKFHDIPNTVAGACRAAAELGVWMLNVHILGGLAMMKAAREAIDSVSGRKPLLIGVTILTSLQSEDLQRLHLQADVPTLVRDYALLAVEVGFDGIVCSAHEAAMLRKVVPKDFLLVTPGIRLANSPPDDQKRIMTPQEALSAGANYLVIGRPITAAENPREVLMSLGL